MAPDPPVLLTHQVTYQLVDGVDTSGEPTGQAVLLTFYGDTLVDGEKVAGTVVSAVMPVTAFAPLLWNLDNFAVVNGLRQMVPQQRCDSQLVSQGNHSRGLGWVHAEVWHCTFGLNHPGNHIDTRGQTWTTDQSVQSFANWEHVSRRDGDATAASFPR